MWPRSNCVVCNFYRMHFGRPAIRLPTNCAAVVSAAMRSAAFSPPTHRFPLPTKPALVSNLCSNPFAGDTFPVKIYSSSLWQRVGTGFSVFNMQIRRRASSDKCNRANEFLVRLSSTRWRDATPNEEKNQKYIYINKNKIKHLKQLYWAKSSGE